MSAFLVVISSVICCKLPFTSIDFRILVLRTNYFTLKEHLKKNKLLREREHVCASGEGVEREGERVPRRLFAVSAAGLMNCEIMT